VGRLLIGGQDGFLAEARDVLPAGLVSAACITVDDTGARHRAVKLHSNRQRALRLVRRHILQEPPQLPRVAARRDPAAHSTTSTIHKAPKIATT
jgi:hypothetical protein